MFKFKGISSTDMQVVIEEEEHFIARAAKKYETIEIEGRDGAIFNELGYSYVERPIYVQCLNTNKIDEILAWLDGEGEFEYKGRKTTARFYTILEPKREACIKIIDTTFIRDPFWNKANEEYQTVKESKIKTATGNPIHIADSTNLEAKLRLNGGSKQETREGSNLLDVLGNKSAGTTHTVNGITYTINADGSIKVEGTATENADYFIAGNWGLTEPIIELDGTYTLQLVDNTNTAIRIYLLNQSNVINSTYGNTTLTKTENVTGWFIRVNSGATVNTTIYSQLVKGGETKPYEQYGAMPSPEYPSKVETVGSNGSVEIDVCNKNFLKFIETDKTQSGLDVVASNNSIEVNGTSTASINLFNVFEDIKLKKGTYTFSFKAQNPPPANSTQFILCKEDGSRITTLNAWGNTNSNTITLEEDIVISSSKSCFYVNKNITFSNTKYELQIEKGESATEIIEPQSQTKIMPIQQEM